MGNAEEPRLRPRLVLRALVLVALLLVVPLASAVEIDLEAREDSQGASYFALRGDDARNPTLSAAPGDTLVVRFTNRGALSHNVRFGAPLDVGTPCCQAPNASATVTIMIPANLTGEVAYVDALHGGAAGVLRVGAPLPAIRIDAPASGASVARRVTMSVTVTRFSLTDGQIRWSWDAGNRTLNATSRETTHVFEGLGNGPHLLQAELVDANGRPLSPRATDDVVVVIAESATDDSANGASATPTPSEPPSPAPSKSPDVALPLVVAALALVALRRRR